MGQERDRLAITLLNASVAEKVRAYNDLLKKLLKEAPTEFERREVHRRITEDLLAVTSAGPWKSFAVYLRRLEKLGYSSMDRRLLVCALAARAAKGSRAGIRKTAALLKDIERRTARARQLQPELREEIAGAVARARTIAGLPAPTRDG